MSEVREIKRYGYAFVFGPSPSPRLMPVPNPKTIEKRFFPKGRPEIEYEYPVDVEFTPALVQGILFRFTVIYSNNFILNSILDGLKG